MHCFVDVYMLHNINQTNGFHSFHCVKSYHFQHKTVRHALALFDVICLEN